MRVVLVLTIAAALLLTGCPPQNGRPPVTAVEAKR